MMDSTATEEVEKLKKQVQELTFETVKKLSAKVEEHEREIEAVRRLPRI
jgi:hypothetical protein